MKINFPDQSVFKIREQSGTNQIFDPIRKLWVALQPEEWVRQNILYWLTKTKGFPDGRIAVEKELVLNSLKKRPDIVVYDKDGLAKIIIECKAPEVKLSQSTIEQIARYNLILEVPTLIISNGHQSFCFELNAKKKEFNLIEDLPRYFVN